MSVAAPARAVRALARPRRRVLVIVQGDLGDRPLGPEMRGLAIARGFAVHHDVTIAASTQRPFVHDGMRVVPRSRASLWREMLRHDVVVGPVLPPHLMSMLAPRRCIRVSDLYDPVELESATVAGNDRVVGRQRRMRRLQLRWSDVVVSANERQRELARADLRAAARRGAAPLLVKVAMGLPDPPPEDEPGRDRPLRGRLGIPDGDPVVLWWGTAWRWLDAVGAVRAIGELARRRPDVHLVITAGAPRNPRTDALNATADARRVAAELGLLDRSVHFFEDWIGLGERHRHLTDADLGITLSTAGPEAALAARTRYMDYLWAGLPSVLTAGDELADEMAATGAARLVAPHDPRAVAGAIEQLLDDPAAMEAARGACRAMAERYRWSAVVEPLVAAVEELELTGGGARDTAAVVCDSGAYYAQRLRETGLDVGGRLARSLRRAA